MNSVVIEKQASRAGERKDMWRLEKERVCGEVIQRLFTACRCGERYPVAQQRWDLLVSVCKIKTRA